MTFIRFDQTADKVKVANPVFSKMMVDQFYKEWGTTSKYHGQRLGQAFYNHFNLHKVGDQQSLGRLYELDKDEAKKWIDSHTDYQQ